MSYVTMGLPPEVLAAFLRFLAFRDLIAASHVSQFWRSSALAFPDLWLHISVDTLLWRSPDVLDTAIARVGRHPVDLEFIPPGPVTEGMADAIAEHMHRLTSLKWTYSLKPVDTTRPAQLLRELSCEEVRFRVPKKFLGGSPGALRTLLLGEAIFPRVCPALATVTHLRATFPEHYEEDTGFRYLFALCPRLETLHLHELADRASIGLPTCPAPRTLRDVVLQSFGGCDLLELYASWALHSVQHVQLCMPIEAGIGVHAPSFFGDALTLSVSLSSDSEAHIVAQLPDARTRTLVCSELTDVRHPRSRLAHMLYAPNLRTLTVPLAVLVHAVRRHRWPRLAHLTVHIHETTAGSSGAAQGRPCFRIAALECLRAVGATLEMLELYFYGSSATDPVTSLEDGEELKERLFSLRDCLPDDVHVYDFPPEVAREMAAIGTDLPRVVFH